MIDLSDVTVILVFKNDHEERLRNAETVVGFLNHHFRTRVFVVESGRPSLGFLPGMRNLEVRHVALEGESRFHRTRYINMMLEEVETPVVANHDIDVVLHPSSYAACRDLLLRGEADMVYPYGYGEFQVQVPMGFDHAGFRLGGYDVGSLPGSRASSRFGHCVFFRTDHYRSRGGENEGFVSYGPEDRERAYRFSALGSRLARRDGLVYHFEHPRGPDSSSANSDFAANCRLMRTIYGLDREGLERHYASAGYLGSYRKVRWDPGFSSAPDDPHH